MTELKDVQELELKILDHTIYLLNSLDLKWFAYGGTLLGAVREGGFIPWDDDIDIIMPRDDYNKFLHIGKYYFSDPYFFQTPNTDSICNTIIKIRYNGTSAIGKWARDVHFNRGVFIDIFPLDHIPDDLDKRNMLMNNIDYIFNCEKFDKSDVVRNPKKYMKNTNANLFNFFNDFMTHIDEKYCESEFVSCPAMWRYLDSRGVYNKFDFSSYEEKDFSGLNNKIRIPIGYDNILTVDYGDWRTPLNVPGTHGKLIFDLNRDPSYYDSLSEEDFNKLFENT